MLVLSRPLASRPTPNHLTDYFFFFLYSLSHLVSFHFYFLYYLSSPHSLTFSLHVSNMVVTVVIKIIRFSFFTTFFLTLSPHLLPFFCRRPFYTIFLKDHLPPLSLFISITLPFKTILSLLPALLIFFILFLTFFLFSKPVPNTNSLSFSVYLPIYLSIYLDRLLRSNSRFYGLSLHHFTIILLLLSLFLFHAFSPYDITFFHIDFPYISHPSFSLFDTLYPLLLSLFIYIIVFVCLSFFLPSLSISFYYSIHYHSLYKLNDPSLSLSLSLSLSHTLDLCTHIHSFSLEIDPSHVLHYLSAYFSPSLSRSQTHSYSPYILFLNYYILFHMKSLFFCHIDFTYLTFLSLSLSLSLSLCLSMSLILSLVALIDLYHTLYINLLACLAFSLYPSVSLHLLNSFSLSFLFYIITSSPLSLSLSQIM
ncbi:unnamed protein product [Acanthosepion pharaonis]|uniref:Uncharacterized protein n=1 Tax=Acanthosepion pharaonis TaxID=158019 RepID=A0A812ARP8_ACAPH|nr:unnamed protein product [Sepia pharaonis]